MSPTLWSGAAAVPGVLQLGRAQLWFGCILYFYCWTLTVMSLVSHEWSCSLGVIDNASCPQCPSWQFEHGKDNYQLSLLAAATVLGAVGYLCLGLRWLPAFARFPALKLVSVLLLVAVIVLDFEAHYSYRSQYDSSVASSANSDTLFFCTAYSYAEIAAVYGCITVGLLAWHEWVEWSVRRRMRERREQRRRLRVQQEQQQQQQGESDQPMVVVERPDVTADKQQAAATPAQLEAISTESPSPAPVASPPPTSAMSSHQNGIVSATSSSYVTSHPNGTSPLAASTSSNRPSSSCSSSISSAAAEWCERLGLYTRADSRLDSVLLKWSWKDQLSPMQRRLVLGVNIFFLLLYFGGLIISAIEGWALQDGVNYILSSWCTLGYGLYTPITTGGRIFMYFYWPVGFIVISSTSTTMWRVILARTDRILREATERLVGREPAAAKAKSASQRASAQRKDRSRRAEVMQGTEAAHTRGDGSDSEEERGSATQRHTSYPALKDIVFSPSHKQPTLSSPHSARSQAKRSDDTSHQTRTAPPASHVEPTDGIVDDALTDKGTRTLASPSFPSPAAHVQSNSQVRSFAQPSSPAVDNSSASVAATPRRFPLPAATVDGPARQYAPTASYPLTWGRGHLALTVYEAENEEAPLPSLADVFAPLNSTSPANAHTAQSHGTETASAAPAPPPQLSRSLPALRPSKLSLPSTPTATTSPATRTNIGGIGGSNGSRSRDVGNSALTMVPSALRDDFLAHLRQQTSHEQLQRDIRHRRSSSTPAQLEVGPALRRLSAVYEDADDAVQPSASPHSSVSSQPSPLPPSHAPPAPSTPLASAALGLAAPSAHPPLRASSTYSAALPPPLLRELAPLLMKLAIAVLAVICWICVAGGVLVWTEGGTYDYWQCQWSAFNLLTTISVGAIATPFSTRTSAFLVWYLLLGVGTLAYCFALIAQLAFIAFDKREALMHQHARSIAHMNAAAGGASDAAVATGKKKGEARQGEEGFVAHAKELDSLILQLVQKQADAIQSEQDSEKQHAAFMRYPVLMFGGEGASGEQVEVPLEGVSLLLRYHLAFQAFEKERARMEAIRMARAERRARQQQSGSSRRIGRLDTSSSAASVDGGQSAGGSGSQHGVVITDGDGGGTVQDGADGAGHSEDDGDEDEDEEKLAGAGPTDRYFDWSNDTDWIAQAEQESSVAPDPPVDHG